MLGGEQVVNKLIKLPVNVSETDLKLLSAVLNASMTDIPLEGFTAELMEKVMRSAGASFCAVDASRVRAPAEKAGSFYHFISSLLICFFKMAGILFPILNEIKS